MKIVINIDDNLYTRLFDNGADNYDDAVDMAKSIRKGTPLPKGHGDLIDADKMIKELNERIQTFDEGRNEILKELGRPEENNQIPLWLWKGCCITCGIIIEADKENK